MQKIKIMTHYFLFGSEAVSYHYNQEFENIQTCKFDLFKFTDKSTPIDLLIAYEGWKDWCIITEEEYLKLEQL